MSFEKETKVPLAKIRSQEVLTNQNEFLTLTEEENKVLIVLKGCVADKLHDLRQAIGDWKDHARAAEKALEEVKKRAQELEVEADKIDVLAECVADRISEFDGDYETRRRVDKWAAELRNKVSLCQIDNAISQDIQFPKLPAQYSTSCQIDFPMKAPTTRELEARKEALIDLKSAKSLKTERFQKAYLYKTTCLPESINTTPSTALD